MITRANKMASLIKARRNELKISQIELGRQLGWTSSKGQVVSNVERGLQQIPSSHLNRLSIILVIPREQIIEAYIEDFKDSLYKELNK
jgi:transcriptional regulator with XRE-family HTH domain